jgi:predicted metal-dependent hydrolase
MPEPLASPAGRPSYLVRRSDRARRSRLTVTETGEVIVVLPRRAPGGDAALLVARHARWLDRHIAKVRDERARLDARPALADGRVLQVGGTPLEIRVVDGVAARDRDVDGAARGRVEAAAGQVIVRLGRDGRDAPAVLEAWLRARARQILAERVAAHAPGIGVRPGRIAVRDQRSRWASASRSGSLSFSWRLILAPPFVLDAVVVHELAHLRIRGHSPAFWRLVTSHAPRTPEARRWLRENAREVRAALA